MKSWEGGSRELSTEIRVDPGEFVDYEVFTGRVDLTLPMREFRVSIFTPPQSASITRTCTDRARLLWL